MNQRIFNIKRNRDVRSELRSNMPEPERVLWRRIRAKQLGVKFRRQHGIGFYIVDFYCPEKHLVIELDGDSHYTPEAQAYDQERDDFMKSMGLNVMRFSNQQVMTELDSIVDVIYQFVYIK